LFEVVSVGEAVVLRCLKLLQVHGRVALLNAILALNTNSSVDGLEYISNALWHVNAMEQMENLLFLAPPGADVIPETRVDDRLETLMMTDGCVGSRVYEACSAVQNGLFKQGLHAAIQYYITTIRDVLAPTLGGNFSNTNTTQKMASRRWQNVEEIAFYMNDALTTAKILRHNTIIARGDSFAHITNVAQVGYFVHAPEWKQFT
jgi:hypothetical protein